MSTEVFQGLKSHIPPESDDLARNGLGREPSDVSEQQPMEIDSSEGTDLEGPEEESEDLQGTDLQGTEEEGEESEDETKLASVIKTLLEGKSLSEEFTQYEWQMIWEADIEDLKEGLNLSSADDVEFLQDLCNDLFLYYDNHRDALTMDELLERQEKWKQKLAKNSTASDDLPSKSLEKKPSDVSKRPKIKGTRRVDTMTGEMEKMMKGLSTDATQSKGQGLDKERRGVDKGPPTKTARTECTAEESEDEKTLGTAIEKLLKEKGLPTDLTQYELQMIWEAGVKNLQRPLKLSSAEDVEFLQRLCNDLFLYYDNYRDALTMDEILKRQKEFEERKNQELRRKAPGIRGVESH